MFKKITALCLVAIMIISLTACGQEDIASQDLMKNLTTDTKDSGQTDTENIFCDSDRPAGGVSQEEASVAVTDFAVRLFQNSLEMEMVSGQEAHNVLISPISVFMALSMTANGARGETLAQMEQVLGLTSEDLNTYAENYLDTLPSGENYKLSMANSIWFRDEADRLKVEEDFLQKNRDYYGADIYKSAFDETTVQDINFWVEDKTDGLIRELLNKIPPDAVMYLVNALAFDAKWQKIYNTSDVREGIFHVNTEVEQEVEMMHSEEGAYIEDDKASGFIKYYEDRKYAFAALLPKEGVSVYQYVSSLTGEHLQEMLSNPTAVMVHATMPKFEVEYQTEMSKVLKDMGMVDAFGAAADLTGIGTSTRGNLLISRVLHKTFISVDELGTKAGAVTAIEVVDESETDVDSRTVTLDRPFVYMIIDCENNQPIFMGTVECVEPYACDTVE